MALSKAFVSMSFDLKRYYLSFPFFHQIVKLKSKTSFLEIVEPSGDLKGLGWVWCCQLLINCQKMSLYNMVLYIFLNVNFGDLGRFFHRVMQ